jgi:hypothetical protein
MKSATRNVYTPIIQAMSIVAVRPCLHEVESRRLDNASDALAGRRAR